MSAFNEEKVLEVHHWTDKLFTFKTTRDTSLRFSNGHFTMIGLPVDGKPLVRAYSIVSANYEDHLEFLSIKVPDGPLTSRLQHIKVGDSIVVGRKPTGLIRGAGRVRWVARLFGTPGVPHLTYPLSAPKGGEGVFGLWEGYFGLRIARSLCRGVAPG